MNNLMRWSGLDITDPVRRFLEGETGSWVRVEEYREGDSMVVRAQVPGIDPDRDVDITLERDELGITVRHEEKSERKDKRGYRSEFRYGTFTRTVRLPAAVDEKDVSASYTDGILEVRIPMPEQSATQPRKIPITRSGQSGDAMASGSTTSGTASPEAGSAD